MDQSTTSSLMASEPSMASFHTTEDSHHNLEEEPSFSSQALLTQRLFSPDFEATTSTSGADGDDLSPPRTCRNRCHRRFVRVFLRVGQIYWESRQARFFIGLAAMSWVPITVILMAVVHWFVHSVFHTTDMNDPRFIHKNFLGILMILMIRLLLNHVVGILSEGAIAWTAANVALGRGERNSRASAMEALRVVLRQRIWTLLGTGVVLFAAIFIGYCFFFVVGLVVVVTFYLAAPAIVLEPQHSMRNPFDALFRSWELAQGQQIFFFTCHCLLLIIQSMVAHIVNAIFSTSTGTYGHLFSVWGTLVGVLPSLLFVPAFSILKTVLYIRVRVEKEGLTAAQLEQEMTGSQSDQHGALLGSSTAADGGPDYRELAFEEEDANSRSEASGTLIAPAIVSSSSFHQKSGASSHSSVRHASPNSSGTDIAFTAPTGSNSQGLGLESEAEATNP